MDSRHPLVIVLVIAVIGIGFYYYASPYENCMRKKIETSRGMDITQTVCNAKSNW